MKNTVLKYFALICLCCFSQSLSVSAAAPKPDSLLCLQLEGIILNANESVNGDCVIELISLSSTDTVILKEGKKKFMFALNKDSRYAIRISKKGYVSKLVCINTAMLTKMEGLYRFEFETSLLGDEDAKRLNPEVIDFPVAMIAYDYGHKCFSYDKDYSGRIKKELYKKRMPCKSPAQCVNAEVIVSK